MNHGFRVLRSWLGILITLALLLTFVPHAEAQPPDPPPNVYPALLKLAAERPNEKLPVIIQKMGDDKRAEAAVARNGGSIRHDLPFIRSFAAELPARAILALAQAPGIRWIALDAPMISTSTPVDTSKLINTYIRSIRAHEVWNEAPYLQGNGITVAVVDSGVQSWADLQQDISGANRILTWTHFSDDVSKSAEDAQGHGSHVAGIIGGSGLLSAGEYIGIAPRVNLVSVKVSNALGASRTSDVVSALQWIYTNKDLYNIRVVNLSLNSTVSESYHSSPLAAAVELLWFNGIVVVVSAGNNGTGTGPVTMFPPANDPFAIVVGAADEVGTANISDDLLATFSAYGVTVDNFAKPDLVAPGRRIVSVIGRRDAKLMKAYPAYLVTSSNQTTPYYFRMSGTSMAAPMVTGAVALLLQDEPWLTPDQVKYRLMATARPFAGPQPGSTGAGYLDIYAAVHGTTTASANVGIPMSQFLGDGTGTTIWNSVNWNSVNWNSVNWNSVNWNSADPVWSFIIDEDPEP